MYKLYYSPGACSMAIHVLLNELNQPVEAIKRDDVKDYKATVNPTNGVPVLDDNGTIIKEGAAIALYLLEKHKSDMLPSDMKQKANVLNWLLFANATLHPAYSKMFFVKNVFANDPKAQEQGFKAAAEGINKFWKIIDDQLAKTKYISGDHISAADIMVSVYANWNGYFTTPITLGENVKRLLKEVSSRPAFKKAVEAEKVEYKAAA